MVAVISYFLVAMMAVLFAQRHNYSVDNNQELAANGLSCIVGAFFNSLASSTSPPRCFLMESTGGRTQVCIFFREKFISIVKLFFLILQQRYCMGAANSLLLLSSNNACMAKQVP